MQHEYHWAVRTIQMSYLVAQEHNWGERHVSDHEGVDRGLRGAAVARLDDQRPHLDPQPLPHLPLPVVNQGRGADHDALAAPVADEGP